MKEKNMKKIKNLIITFCILILISITSSCKKQYEVTFDYNNLQENEVIKTKGNIMLPTTLIDGYEFKGWFLENGQQFSESKVDKDITLFAKFAKIYTVTFNNGNAIKKVKTTGELTYPTFNKYGYRFIGWVTENQELFNSNQVTSDLDLFAVWQEEYNVYLHFENGMDTEVYKSIGEMPSIIPTRAGYEFLGWYSKDDVDYTNKEISEDIHLYAKWFKLYEVVFEFNNGLENKIVLTKDKITLPYDIVKENHNFAGWYKEDGTKFIEETVTSDLKLVAKWIEIGQEFNFTYELDGGKFNSTIYPKTYITGEVQELKVPTKKYHEFEGWFLDKNFIDGPYDVINEIMEGDLTFYAKWKDIASYEDVTYYLDGGTLSNELSKYIPGEEYILPIATKANHIFRGFYLNADFTGQNIKKITKDQTGSLTLYANFEKIDFTKLNISIIGDSISTYEGYIPEDYPAYYPQAYLDVDSVEKTWWHQVLSHFNTNLCVNSSYSGGVLKPDVNEKSALNSTRLDNLKTITTIPDIIIIYIGINDCKVGYQSILFERDYKDLIETLQEKYNQAQIFVCTYPYSRLGLEEYKELKLTYSSIVRSLADKYHLGLIDIEKVITDTNYYQLMANPLHPTAKGMTVIAEEAIKAIEEFFKL